MLVDDISIVELSSLLGRPPCQLVVDVTVKHQLPAALLASRDNGVQCVVDRGAVGCLSSC
jgi:hypothetical protein